LANTSGVICVELVRRLQATGARFVETGVHHYPRQHGSSTFFTPRNVARTLNDLVKLWVELMVLGSWRSANAETRRRLRGTVMVAGLVGVLAAALLASARVPVNRSDEAWFLWVAHRANNGSVLYRDVYYVTTPLAMWIMQLAAKLLGTTLTVERALNAACFTASLGLLWCIARRVGVSRSVRSIGGLVLFMVGSRVAHFGSVYSILAVTCSLAALLVMLAWLDAGPRLRLRSQRWSLLGAGAICGVAWATKPNTGTLALVAVLATVWVAPSADCFRRGRRLLTVAGGFAGVTAAMIAVIIAQGSWSDFVSDVFTGKSDYIQLLGDNGFNSITRAMTLWTSPEASWGRRLAGTAPLITLVILAALFIMIRSRRVLKRSPQLVALASFVLVGLGATIPDFGPQHVTEAAPLLIGLGGITLATCWAIRTPLRSPARPVVAITLVVALVAVGTVVADARQPTTGRSDQIVAAGFANFSGTQVSAKDERQVQSDLAVLRLRTGGRVFIVNAEAPFYYLAGGLKNPTPFDFPARTDFGAGGENGVVLRVRHSHVRWVCLRGEARKHSSVRPVHLERQLRKRMQFVQHLHLCDLYRRGHDHGLNTAPLGGETQDQYLAADLFDGEPRV
jgi:hypothetical protein